jgi:hypothetical protein
MLRKSYFLGAATVLVVILSIAWLTRDPVAAQKKPAPVSQKWEYKVKAVSALALDHQEKSCNKLGSEGWELCATERNSENGAKGVTFIIFKRPER